MSDGTDTPDTPAERPSFSLKEAANVTGTSLSTIRRKHKAGAFENAALTDGRWLIPVNDLLAAGFRVNAPSTPASDGHDRPATPPDRASELAELRYEVRLEQERRRSAEQLAETLRVQVEDYRDMLRMLEAGPNSEESSSPEQRPEKPKRWWHRSK